MSFEVAPPSPGSKAIQMMLTYSHYQQLLNLPKNVLRFFDIFNFIKMMSITIVMINTTKTATIGTTIAITISASVAETNLEDIIIINYYLHVVNKTIYLQA